MKLTKTVFLQYLKLDTVTIVWLLLKYIYLQTLKDKQNEAKRIFTRILRNF